MAGSEHGWKDFRYFRHRMETSDEQARANLREQAEILAESGVGLPHRGADRQHRAAPLGDRGVRRHRPAGVVRVQVPP